MKDLYIAYLFASVAVLLGKLEMLMMWLACPWREPQELPVTQKNI